MHRRYLVPLTIGAVVFVTLQPLRSQQIGSQHTDLRPPTSAYSEPAGPHLDPAWYERQGTFKPRPKLLTPTVGSRVASGSGGAPAPAPTSSPRLAETRRLPAAPRQPALVQPAFTRQQSGDATARISDYVGPNRRTRTQSSQPSRSSIRISPQPEANYPSFDSRSSNSRSPRAASPSRPDSPSRIDAQPGRESTARNNVDTRETLRSSEANRPRRILASPNSRIPRRTPGVRRVRAGGKLQPLQLPTEVLLRREALLQPRRSLQEHVERDNSSSPSSGADQTPENGSPENSDSALRAAPASRDRNVRRAATSVTREVRPLQTPIIRRLPSLPDYQRITPPADSSEIPVYSKDLETNRRLTELRSEVRSTLRFYFDRLENAATRSPWGMMHAILPFGVDTELIADGRRINAIGWLCWNGNCWGQHLLYTENGQIRVDHGPGVQGHSGQFLAILAQCKVPKTFEIRVDGYQFTIEDLIQYEMQTCESKTELTFKLIGLSHYLPSETTWKTPDGETWSIPRLIKEELAAEVNGAACGGTHRIMAYAYSVNRRHKRGEPLDGAWLLAQKAVEAYLDRLAMLRNPDGSYSTNWLEKRGADEDIDRRMKTTGHLVEWLVFVLPKEALVKPDFVETIEYLNRLMSENRDREWSVGPKGHALRALALYDERVFGGRPGQRKTQLVSRQASTR